KPLLFIADSISAIAAARRSVISGGVSDWNHEKEWYFEKSTVLSKPTFTFCALAVQLRRVRTIRRIEPGLAFITIGICFTPMNLTSLGDDRRRPNWQNPQSDGNG